MKRSCTEDCSLPFAGWSETRRAWSWTKDRETHQATVGNPDKRWAPTQHQASLWNQNSHVSSFCSATALNSEGSTPSGCTHRELPQTRTPSTQPLASPLGSGCRMKTLWFLHQSLTTFPFTHHSALFAWYRRRLFIYRRTNTKPREHHKGWKFSYGHYFAFALFQQLFSTLQWCKWFFGGVCACVSFLAHLWSGIRLEEVLFCHRFLQVLNNQLWVRLSLKIMIITQHQFSAAAKEDAPIIHNIIITFPWQLQNDCTVSNGSNTHPTIPWCLVPPSRQ